MLYERWQQVASLEPAKMALADLACGRSWTFGELAAEAEALPRAKKVVFPQGDGSAFVFSVLNAWRDGSVVCPLEPGQPHLELISDFPAGIVHLKTTSATTGLPRRVMFEAGQIAADAENIVRTMELSPAWPNIGVISLAHSYGFSNLVLPLLLHGIPLVLPGTPLPEPLRRAAALFPEVTLAAVPALWRAWLGAGAIPRNARLSISAGAPLPLALEQEVYKQSGVKIHNFYGSSECGGIAYDTSTQPRNDEACVGSLICRVGVTVDENGCLQIRGPAVGAGYWPEPDETLGCGVFRTSDFGEVRGGLLFLTGRAGDQINVAGRKVSPELIERTLMSHPAVRECLVFGSPSPEGERGEMIVACVASMGGTGSEELRQHLLARLPGWQVPRKWWLVESLDANARGKLSRAEWRRKYLAGEGTC